MQDNNAPKEQTEQSRARRTIMRLVHGMEIDGQWFRHNLGFIGVITVGLLVFVTNRYQADQEMIVEDQLKDTLADIRYRAVTKSAELTLQKRTSNLEERLRQRGDSTLKVPVDAPYIIKQPAKDAAE